LVYGFGAFFPSFVAYSVQDGPK